MKGGAFGVTGLGRAVSGVLGVKLSGDQDYKNYLDALSSFEHWALPNGSVKSFLWDIRKGGVYGVVNIQTENDVIALYRLYVVRKLQQDMIKNANVYKSSQLALINEWEAAGKPEPIFGDVMKNAVNILDKASMKGLLRIFDTPNGYSSHLSMRRQDIYKTQPGEPPEAANAVHALNEADDARLRGRISAAEYSNAIGAITYDATPYYTSPSKGGRSRKNKKTYKNKNRRNKRKNNTRKYN
jgi:hypothetical protein